jgi:hypothetical protein
MATYRMSVANRSSGQRFLEAPPTKIGPSEPIQLAAVKDKR